jgi:hypothetical protein
MMKNLQGTPVAPPTPGTTPTAKWFSKPWLRKWWPALAGGGVIIVGLAFLLFRGAPTRPSAFARDYYPLLQQEGVQKDLDLDPEQLGKLNLLFQQRQQAREEMKDLKREERDRKMIAESYDNEKEIRAILDAEQIQRLKQVYWQLRGTRVWGDEEVVRALKLTHDQRVEMASMRNEYDKQSRELTKIEKREEQDKKRDELKKSTNEKLLAVLTADQQAKYEELMGPPFTGEVRRGGGGRTGGANAKGGGGNAKGGGGRSRRGGG